MESHRLECIVHHRVVLYKDNKKATPLLVLICKMPFVIIELFTLLFVVNSDMASNSSRFIGEEVPVKLIAFVVIGKGYCIFPREQSTV